MVIDLPTLTCTRCGHRWYPAKPQPPKNCPKCKSPYWDRPRQRPKNGTKAAGVA